jgi:hypothetical protein
MSRGERIEPPSVDLLTEAEMLDKPVAPEGEPERTLAGAGPTPTETGDEAESAAARAAESDTDGADPFGKFAPAPAVQPTRWQRARRRVGRVLSHEWTLAAGFSMAIAAAMTWPTLRYPKHTIPADIWDPTLQTWQMAWSGHAMKTDPSQLWNSNTFYPEQLSFAFSDTLLGYFPAGMIGTGPEAALVRYNIMFFLLHALAFFGGYALARQLGARISGAAVTGAAFAFAPWRWAQAGHMHVLSVGGIALALAMLARGHGYSFREGYNPDKRKPWWALAGWLVAAWQISLGFGIGLPFAYVLAGIGLVCAVIYLTNLVRRRAKPFGANLLAADAVGVVLFGLTGALISSVYFKVLELHPYAARQEIEVSWYSPSLLGFFTAPEQSSLWGDAHAAAREALGIAANEKTLLPGFTLYGLAAAGLIFSIWSLRTRLLLFAGVVLSVILAMGTKFFGGRPGYMTLYDVLPGWNSIRTPGRLAIWTTLLLGLLAAGAVSAFAERAKDLSKDRVTSRSHPLLALALLIPFALVLAEGVQRLDFPVVPTAPAAIAEIQGPALVLPSDQLRDENIMLWATDKFPQIVNGGSGFTPQTLSNVREAAKNFPDQTSVDLLRSLGVKQVVVLKQYAEGTDYANALTATGDGLGIKREDRPDAVVFTLS